MGEIGKITGKRPPLGAHTSIAGGVFTAIRQGVEIEADVVQIFSKNQRQWLGKPYSEEELETYFKEREETGIHPVVIHDSYLINLASPKKDILEKSIQAFADELQRGITLKIPYVLTHPGSHLGEGESFGIKQIGESLKQCWEMAGDDNIMIILETTAGQGTNLGYTFEQIRDMIDSSGIEPHVGVCIDTCHIFAAGYDIRSKEAWEQTLDRFDEVIGLSKLKLFHLNDSRHELGSRKDRHARIGEGFIGKEGFETLLNNSRVNHLPMILEIPGGLEAYREDLILLRTFRNAIDKS
ncbi:MAG: deoxyribonuclease IV [Calditrichaeota bacterium]|nr:MAG: deoxyribonuclease IV [Calditrichota bacterium]